MCGRYTLTADSKNVQQTFDLAEPPVLAARYNIAPTQPVAIITHLAPRELTLVRWGLIPSWSKDPMRGAPLINARSETVAEKPAFRSAYKYRRCLIPADGFFEWATDTNGKKRPHYIHLRNRQLFAFAGIWERWQNPEGDEILSCSILTSEPNDLIRPLHNRMAVILPAEAHADWITPDTDPDLLNSLLQPYPASEMETYEISTLVNNVRNDSPEIVEPYKPPSQQNLF